MPIYIDHRPHLNRRYEPVDWHGWDDHADDADDSDGADHLPQLSIYANI